MCSGRRNACVTYCITYILSCVTKHSSEFFVLMVGRILGGIATSLLFSAFESWLVAEHFKVRAGALALALRPYSDAGHTVTQAIQ